MCDKEFQNDGRQNKIELQSVSPLKSHLDCVLKIIRIHQTGATPTGSNIELENVRHICIWVKPQMRGRSVPTHLTSEL